MTISTFNRIWKAGGLCTHVLEGHRDAITSVCIVNHEGCSNERKLLCGPVMCSIEAPTQIKWNLLIEHHIVYLYFKLFCASGCFRGLLSFFIWYLKEDFAYLMDTHANVK